MTIEKTIDSAMKHDVVIGAHPSYPDLSGFGRRYMRLADPELKACIKYQVGALVSLARSKGATVRYVKPHGALYNACFERAQESVTIIEAIREIDENLIYMGLAGSLMEEVANDMDQPFVAEGFADRRYTRAGRLQSRSEPGSVIEDAVQASDQVVKMVLEGKVISHDGIELDVEPGSICIHGDNPGAIRILQALNQTFARHGITKKAFAR